MRFLALALVLLSFSVHAELYRWIDRPSGSVKYSSTPSIEQERSDQEGSVFADRAFHRQR